MSQLLDAGWLPAALAAFAATLALTPASALLAKRFDIVARPTGDRWHRSIIPMLGGTAIFGGTLVPLALPTLHVDGTLAGVVLASGLMFAVGLVDDFLRLKPSTKLAAQIAIGCLVLYMGRHVDWTGIVALDALLTLLWVVGLANAFNLLDNMDGLCAGTAAIASAAAAVSVWPVNPSLAIFAAGIGGACLAFLVFNFKPASIFMGDSGSLFLGTALALLTLTDDARTQAGFVSALAVPVLIMLIPIFDVTFVTMNRLLSRRSAAQGGTDHTSHRLVAMGFSEREAVLLLYGFAAACALVATLLSRAAVPAAGVLTVLVTLCVVLLGVQLARVRVYDGQDFAALQGKPYTPLLIELTYRRRIFEIVLDVCLITLAYYAAYVVRFDDQFSLNYPKFVESLPVVIGCQLVSFQIAGVYRGVWRFVGLDDLATYARGLGLGVVSSVIALVYLYRFEEYSRGVFIIDALLLGLFMAGSRLSFRILGELSNRRRQAAGTALIYGAGEGGTVLVRELRNNRRYEHRPLGFLDDDPVKAGKRIMGVPVLGTLADLPELIARFKPDAVIISTSKLDVDRLARIKAACFESGTPLLQLDFRVRPISSESSDEARVG